VLLGFVEAPDQKAAELAAAKAFMLQRVAAQAAVSAGAGLIAGEYAPAGIAE
jgi:hypothetical protein